MEDKIYRAYFRLFLTMLTTTVNTAMGKNMSTITYKRNQKKLIKEAREFIMSDSFPRMCRFYGVKVDVEAVRNKVKKGGKKLDIPK